MISLADIVRAQGQHRGLPPRKLRTLLYNITRCAEIAEAESEARLRLLDKAGIELSGLRYDLEQERAARKTAEQEGIRLQAALDNATSVTVPAAERDIEPGDEPTSPTGFNVRPLWDALGIVPTHVPGWAR